MKRISTIFVSISIALLVWIGGMSIGTAQAPGFKRTELQRHDLGTPGREAVVARGEFEPGATVPKHTHPGEEIAYILEGELTVEVEGKPPAKLKAGDVLIVPANTPHSGTNATKGKTMVLSTYVVEKGKPLATMVK